MKPQDYLKAICMYLPYEVEVYNEKTNKINILKPSNLLFHLDKKSKLILSPLSEVDKKVLREFNFIKIPTIEDDNGQYSFEFVEHCLKNRIDIFGLIGRYAIDKTKLK